MGSCSLRFRLPGLRNWHSSCRSPCAVPGILGLTIFLRVAKGQSLHVDIPQGYLPATVFLSFLMQNSGVYDPEAPNEGSRRGRRWFAWTRPTCISCRRFLLVGLSYQNYASHWYFGSFRLRMSHHKHFRGSQAGVFPQSTRLFFDQWH